MKTESPKSTPLLLLFSQQASGFLHTHTLKLADGTEHRYMSVREKPENGGGNPIIPYFHDGKVIAEVSPEDVVETTQGTFEPIGATRKGYFKPK